MNPSEFKIQEVKKPGGRSKERNNVEGLSEEIIIAKNLRMPENSSDEDAKSRDNRCQMIRRLQAFRWYQYKKLTPRWETLFAFKHPWVDVAALKPTWTRATRPPRPPDADPTTWKTADDFPEEVVARAERAEK